MKRARAPPGVAGTEERHSFNQTEWLKEIISSSIQMQEKDMFKLVSSSLCN